MYYDKDEFGSFKIIKDADNMIVEDTIQIVEGLLPEKCTTMLAGETGSNKSYGVLQMGMSIAANEKHFLGFKINKQNQKVLFIDTECGEKEMVRRYQRILKHLNWSPDAAKRFAMVTITGKSQHQVFDDIENFIIKIKPDIVILDCLYNIMESGTDISVNRHLQPITDRITDMRIRHNITILLVHHMNKGGHELGLIKSRVSGGSFILNSAQHIILMGRTNETNLRLMKIDKSRELSHGDCYYLLDFDFPILKNEGLVRDWGRYVISNQKKYLWAEILDGMNSEFTKKEFEEAVVSVKNVSDRTARTYLNQMVETKVVEKIKQGHYQKRFKISDGNIDG